MPCLIYNTGSRYAEIGIVGSYARGEETEESDIDILVDFSEPIGWEVVDLKEYLEDLLSHRVDLISKGRYHQSSPVVPLAGFFSRRIPKRMYPSKGAFLSFPHLSCDRDPGILLVQIYSSPSGRAGGGG
jgi:predicted nucleotidyltransferase